MRGIGRTVSLGCSLAALTITQSAIAQEAIAREARAEPAAGGASTGDIIVTAQRRNERVRDVPLSITTKTADQLEDAGVSNIRDLTLVTPGLKFDTGGVGFVLPAIRGITTNISGAGAESNVAIYVDGVYQPAQVTNTFDFPDVSRIEVAKGPQGTLFGRNATGGAIQVFTKDPSFTPTGEIQVGYGRFNDFSVRGFVSAPIVDDKLAFSVSGFYNSSDGYYRNLLDGGKNVGIVRSKLVRGKLLWTPTEGIRFTLTGMYMDRRDDSSAWGQALNGNTRGATLPGVVIPTRPYDVALSMPGYSRAKATTVSLKGEFDVGFGTITSVTAYQDTSALLHSDTDFSAAPTSAPFSADTVMNIPEDAFTQELNFASEKFGAFSFIAGAFYFHDQSKFDPLIANGVVYLEANHVHESYAVFGEATVEITDALTLVGGLRYSHDNVLYETGIGFGSLPGLPLSRRVSFDSVTPRFSLRYELSPTTNAYFTYSQGFKSGGAGTADFATTYTYRPEKVKAYEIGIKSAPSRDLSFNAAVFYYDYTDQQQLALELVCPPGGSCAPSARTLNAASSRIYGLDLDATARFGEHFDFAAGLSILDAKYKDFPNAIVSHPVPGGGNATLILPNAGGNQMTRAPKWTLSLVGNYRTEIAGGQFLLSGSVYHSARVFFDFEERVNQPAYTQFNARAEYTLPNTAITLAVFGKNLTDTAVLQSVYINDNADGVSYAPPRTWGVSAGYKF